MSEAASRIPTQALKLERLAVNIATMKSLTSIALAVLVIACGGSQSSDGAPTKHRHAHHEHDAKQEHVDHASKTLQHDFSDPERWSKRFDAPERDQWQKPDIVIQSMAIEPGMVVADIGAGTGYFLPYLSRAAGDGGSVRALDIEPTLVDYMTARATREGLANVTAAVVATDDPGLGERTTDRVLIVDTWHHIQSRGEYAEKIAKGLRAGGMLTVVDFKLDSPRGPPRHHKLPAATIVEELSAAGFDCTVNEQSLPDQYIVHAKIGQTRP